MKTKLLAMMLLAGGSMFAQTRFSVGVGVGGYGAGVYQQPAPYGYSIPPDPGPGYAWIDGYWSQGYGSPVWIPGYWNAPVFRGGYRVEPRFENRAFAGRGRENFNRGFENRGVDHDRGRSSNRSRGR
jgi:hypothetical protein